MVVLKVESIDDIRSFKERFGFIAVVITRHDLLKKQVQDVYTGPDSEVIIQFTGHLSEDGIKEIGKILNKGDKVVAVLPPVLLDALVNTASAPVYRFMMEHIYRDRVTADEED